MKPLTLLLVDDDTVDRAAARRALAAANLPAEVVEAVDSDEAFAALAAQRFDCVLLDLVLPGRDGLEVLLDFAAHGIDVPVVMLTGYGDENVAVKLMKSGAADYVTKEGLTPARMEQAILQAIALHTARREAREAQQAREDLLAVVAHDLRTPLGVVLSCSEALRDILPGGPAGDEMRALADVTERAARRMNKLINDLLDTSSIAAGALRLNLHEADLAELLRESTELLAPLAKQKAIRLETRLAAEDARVRCDRDRIQQVLLNLISNAIKFTPEQGAIVVAAADAVGGAVEEITLSVSDDGPGIPDEAMPHLFERYWTGRGKAGADTGLGLFIAHGIVEAHGSRIAVATGVGLGTSFSFTLPRA